MIEINLSKMARGDAYVIDAKNGGVVLMKRRVYLKLSKQLKGRALTKSIALHYGLKDELVKSFMKTNKKLDKEFSRGKK